MIGDLDALTPDQRALLDSAPGPVLITDPASGGARPRVLYVNRAFEQMTGWSAEEIVGRAPDVLYGEKTDRALIEEMRRRLRAGASWRGETVCYRRDGSPLTVRWSVSAVRGSDGGLRGYMALLEDVTEEREREHAARQADALIARFVDAAPDAVVVTDDRLIIRQVNTGAENTFGWPREDLIGAPLDVLIPPRLHAAHHRHVAAFRAEKATARWMHGRSEIIGLRRNGEEFPASASVVRAGLSQEGYAVILRDLSTHRERERRLQESERRYRALFDMSYQFVGMLDPEGRLLEANRGALDFIGADVDEAIGLPFDQTPWFKGDPAAAAKVRDAVAQAQQGAFVQGQFQLRSQQGELRSFDFSIRPVFDEAGALEFMIPEGRDITALVRTTERMRVNEARLREAQHMAKMGHWRLRLGEEMLEGSEGFLRLLGWDPMQRHAPLSAFLALSGEVDGRSLAGAFRRIEAGAASLDLQHAVTLADGTHKMLQTRMTRMQEPEGPVIAGVTQDVSDRHAAELALRAAVQKAEDANQAKSRFLAMIGHELRTPLNAINGFSEMIAGQMLGPIGDRRYADYAADIHDSGRHLLQLIEGILDVSRMERNALTMHPAPVSARRMMEEATRLTQIEAQRLNVAVELAAVEDVRLDVDPALMQQAILNIARNAVKFSPRGAAVVISAGMEAGTGGYRIEVQDAGPGVPPDEIDKITLPFYQVQGGLDRAHDGSGIGLFLTKSFIEMHGGRFSLTCPEAGGTIARLTLPRARVCDPANPPAPPCDRLPCPLCTGCSAYEGGPADRRPGKAP